MELPKRIVAGLVVYNNLRLLTSKEHRERKIVSAKVMTHVIDSICYPAALVYLPFDIVSAEKYVRGYYGDPDFKYETNHLISFGTILTAAF